MPASTVVRMGETDPKLPDYRLPAVRDQEAELQIVRDVEAGSGRIKQRRTTYLPMHPKEDTENYEIRLNRPAFFNAYARTTGGLTGMVFRRNPVLQDDVPEQLRTHWENIDNAGTHGDVFAKEVCHDMLVAGHAGILVDFPVVDRRLTRAQEARLGIRPFWVQVKKENILSWRVRIVNGRSVLTQLVLREFVEQPMGAFGTETVERYRVLRKEITNTDTLEGPVTFEVWEQRAGKATKTGPSGEIRGVGMIPFVDLYANKTGFLQSKPPLIDLAHLAIRYYQTNSDMLHAAHIANVPIPVFLGVDTEEEIEFGPNTALKIPDPAGKAYWMETTGNAIGQTMKLLDDMRTEMAVLGLGILERRPMTAETATAKRIDRSEKDSQLSSAARSLEDGLERAFGFHAQFMGLADQQGDGGSVTLNKDFLELNLAPEQIRVYLDASKEGKLSVETLWAILAEGNALPANFNATEELVRLKALEPEPIPNLVPTDE